MVFASTSGCLPHVIDEHVDILQQVPEKDSARPLQFPGNFPVQVTTKVWKSDIFFLFNDTIDLSCASSMMLILDQF